MGIGDKLNELLRVRNRKINELASTIGVSPQTLYSIAKRNNTKVDLDVLQKIADELCVTLDYFSDKEQNALHGLSPEAFNVASQYDTLGADGKRAVETILNLELERQRQQDKTNNLRYLSMDELLEANRLENPPQYGVAVAKTGNNEKILVSKEDELEARKILDDMHNQQLD